jgi:pimeloyl-ACP methyl ester carboxylesterase
VTKNPRRRAPSLRFVNVSNATIAVWEWDGDDPPILLVHATGFHGRCWDQVIARLSASRRIVAVDCRGHGQSSVPNPPYLWSHLAGDVAEVVDEMGFDRIVGVGHSMGGHLVTRVAAARPTQFERLLLLDPAIVAPELLDLIAGAQDRIPPVRRRDRFASAEEMAKHLATRDTFSQWDPAVLSDYCQHGLRPAADGNGYELACPPPVEHAIYLGQAESDIYDRMRAIEVPVQIIRCRDRPVGSSMTDFSYSPTWPELVHVIPDATEQHLPNARHFFPMENPNLGAQLIDRASA